MNFSNLRSRLENRPVLKKIVANTGWLALEKVLRMTLWLCVSVMMARYLGPAKFGIFSYANSLVSFLAAFIYLGLSGIVIRDIVKNPAQKDTILGTSFGLKFIGSLIGYLTLILIAFLSNKNSNEFWLLIIIGAGLLFRPFETIDFWFHSQTGSSKSVISKSIASITTSILSIVLIFAKAPLLVFGWIKSFEVILASIFLVTVYAKNKQNVLKWKFSLSKAIELIKQSWMLLFSGFFSMINFKIDQIMLRWMAGPVEVGVYSIAVSLSEVWYFLPTAIALSVYPALIEKKGKDQAVYLEQLQKIFNVMFIISFTLSIAVTLVSKPAIQILYGDAYIKSGPILMIHIWAGVFIFMRALFSRIILIEDLLVFFLLTNFVGAITNCILNIVLIKHFAGYGAAVATLLSYASASYFSLFITKRTKPYAIMMSKSFAMPVRKMIEGSLFKKN